MFLFFLVADDLELLGVFHEDEKVVKGIPSTLEMLGFTGFHHLRFRLGPPNLANFHFAQSCIIFLDTETKHV